MWVCPQSGATPAPSQVGPAGACGEEVPERSRNLRKGEATPAGGSGSSPRRTGLLRKSGKRPRRRAASGEVRTPATQAWGVGVGSMQAGPRPPWASLAGTRVRGVRSSARPLARGLELYPLLSLEEWAQQVGTCAHCSQPEPVHTCVSHSALSTPLSGAPAPMVALGLTWHKRLSLQQTGRPAEWKHSVSEHLPSWLLDVGLSVRTGSGFPFSALKLLSWELDLEQRASMSLLIVKTH